MEWGGAGGDMNLVGGNAMQDMMEEQEEDINPLDAILDAGAA